MPPAFPLEYRSISSGATFAATQLQQIWVNPSTVLSLLLIVCPQVVGAALDQLSGSRVVPVVFSFGWVSYAQQAFLSAIGFNQLISPAPASKPSVLIDTATGRSIVNKSWVLDKILCDFHYWGPKHGIEDDEDDDEESKDDESNIRGQEYEHLVSNKIQAQELARHLSKKLRISVFTTSQSHPPGTYTHDRLWYLGIAVALLQNGIAAIPAGLSGNWVILFLTGTGTILAFATGAIPQFNRDKWGKPDRGSTRTIALTKGDLDHSQDCIVIRSLGSGIDLETLAKGNTYKATPLKRSKSKKVDAVRHTQGYLTRIMTGFLAACWIALLVMVTSVVNDSWYLLGVGTLGIIQNFYVAGAARTPAAQGLDLEYKGTIKKEDAARTLVAAGAQFPGLGLSLFRTLFAHVSEEERRQWWNYLQQRYGSDTKEANNDIKL